MEREINIPLGKCLVSVSGEDCEDCYVNGFDDPDICMKFSCLSERSSDKSVIFKLMDYPPKDELPIVSSNEVLNRIENILKRMEKQNGKPIDYPTKEESEQ